MECGRAPKSIFVDSIYVSPDLGTTLRLLPPRPFHTVDGIQKRTYKITHSLLQELNQKTDLEEKQQPNKQKKTYESAKMEERGGEGALNLKPPQGRYSNRTEPLLRDLSRFSSPLVKTGAAHGGLGLKPSRNNAVMSELPPGGPIFASSCCLRPFLRNRARLHFFGDYRSH